MQPLARHASCRRNAARWLAGAAVLAGTVFGPAAPAQAAIALTQKGPTARSSGEAVTSTLPSASTAGRLLVATMGATGNQKSFTAPAGWVRAAQTTGNNGVNEIWYYPNNPGGIASATFTASGSTGATAALSEYSGVATSSPLDATGILPLTGSATTSATVSTSAATTSADELAVTSWGHGTGGPAHTLTFTPGTGWTNLSNNGSTSLTSHGTSDYRLGLAAGTISETQTASVAGYWTGVIATFKPAPVCNGGSLTMGSPSTIGFPTVTLNGQDRTVTANVALSPSDMTGSASGWRVTGTSTTLTNAAGRTLPTTATRITAATATAASGNCSLPSNSVAYPVTLPAGASAPGATTLFNAAAGSGSGPVNLSLSASLAVPANAYIGTYSSTWTLSIVSGP